ncbi:class I SAM-dependent methyltransferase [Candidatus Thorarchaeota archaeon]|nr:MAG: class I SAM-dependent methyltransferase [Candidatus Thorarchaeota archaeon]
MDGRSGYRKSWQETYRQKGDVWRSMYPRGYIGFSGLSDVVEKAEPDMTVLDVGIGTGEDALPLLKKGVRITGFDTSSEALKICAMKFREAGIPVENYHLVQSSVQEFNYPESKYHIVVDYYTSQHITRQDQGTFYYRTFHCLMPNGMFLLGQFTPQHLSNQQNLKSNGHGVFTSDERYFCVSGTDEMQRKLELLGFSVDSTYRYEEKGFYEIVASRR